jgi:putative ABC transport system permease protein
MNPLADFEEQKKLLRTFKTHSMFKNYFKTAWRNIMRSKGYSALNIVGLATGMAVALLIGLWVYDQYSYDKFLPDYERAYQVRRNFNSNGDTLNFTSTSLKLADALRSQVPEIEYVVETDNMGSHVLTVGDKKLYLQGSQTGADFLKIFPFSLQQGNANTVLTDPYSIVLTEGLATSLFGNENVINKTVRIDDKHDLKVTGILKDLPANSTFQFKFLVPFSYFEATQDFVKEARAGNYSWNGFQIFAKLKANASYTQVSAKIRDIEKTETENTNAMNSAVVLQPLKNWHLYGNYVNGKELGGFVDYVRMFAIIGMLVLIIACINFVNLTTARSEKRAREVGVRKAIGSTKKDLVIQFLIESVLLTFIAFLFSLVIVQLLLPAFNTLTGNKIGIPYANLSFWIIILGCMLTTALAAGSRPAFYLSSFNAVKVLKGTRQVGKSASLPRKIMVVAQFSCSVALIISTIVVYNQIQYAKGRPTGLKLDRLMVTDMTADLHKNYAAIKNELLQKGIAENVTQAFSPATTIYWHSDVDNWPGKNAGETIEMGTVTVGQDYLKTLEMPLAEGTDFVGDLDTTNVIFNEAAIKKMRIQNPINQIVSWQGRQLRIKGVAKDALMISPFAPADPTMFLCQPNTQSVMMYRLSPTIKTQDALTQLNAIFNKYNPAYPYNYSFADESYAAKFKLEVLVGKLAVIFASLAIFISCLGLFGLAAFIASQRTKEIGIRKVLGASVTQVWQLLSKEFIVLVLISCLIASPIALYFLQGWLMQYSYRISIGPWVFVMAALAAIIITILTISFQAIKAALANPVKSLRSE